MGGIEELRSDRIQALAVILENFKQRNDMVRSLFEKVFYQQKDLCALDGRDTS